MSGELQRGPGISATFEVFSVTFEVWRRIEWSGGKVKDWHTYHCDFSTVEAARERIATLPVGIHPSFYNPAGTAEYRIRQAITILEWLE
jgi:hypothetical protein